MVVTGYKRVKHVMVCACSKCKTVLKTRWPETWHTNGWWCRIKRNGKVRLYCPACRKAKKSNKSPTRLVGARKKG